MKYTNKLIATSVNAVGEVDGETPALFVIEVDEGLACEILALRDTLTGVNATAIEKYISGGMWSRAELSLTNADTCTTAGLMSHLTADSARVRMKQTFITVNGDYFYFHANKADQHHDHVVFETDLVAISELSKQTPYLLQ